MPMWPKTTLKATSNRIYSVYTTILVAFWKIMPAGYRQQAIKHMHISLRVCKTYLLCKAQAGVPACIPSFASYPHPRRVASCS